MPQHSRHHAPQLWLGGGPWEVKRQGKLLRCQITKCAFLSHVLVSCQTWRTGGRHSTPNNEWPESRWQVEPCVQFNGSISLRR